MLPCVRKFVIVQGSPVTSALNPPMCPQSAHIKSLRAVCCCCLNSMESEQVRNKQDSLEKQANLAFTPEVAEVAKRPQS